MRCPSIKELPPPPPGKTGWPWTEESCQLLDTTPRLSTWPKISIITPSLNQGQFIEKTIRSVLLQGYPEIEYIVMDGGSTDGSVQTIEKYEKWLCHWQSAPDKGQSQAINKGFDIAKGEVLAWLNSDDHYCQNALSHVAKFAEKFKDFSAIVGACRQVDRVYRRTSLILPDLVTRDAIAPWYFGENQIAQPSCFIMSWAARRTAPLREDLHFVFDYEYWLRLLEIGPFWRSEECLSEILVHPGVKPLQQAGKAFSELIRVMFETGHQGIACSILESTWDRKHRLETFIHQVNSKLPGSLLGILGRLLRKMKWL